MQIPNLPALLFKAIANAHEGLGISNSITPDCPLIYAVEAGWTIMKKPYATASSRKTWAIFLNMRTQHRLLFAWRIENNLELLVNDNWVRV